ncbi:hypothetical protein MC81_20360 [Achromobacter insolitus]|nr:hypothetical protein MC81_20360 [Achromobacter insolitus]
MNCSSLDTTRTLRVRLKDKHSMFLSVQAREVNIVWNYCNELSGLGEASGSGRSQNIFDG